MASRSHTIQLIRKAKSQIGGNGKYTWQGEQLRRKGKLMVGTDPELRLKLLRYFHNSAEGGHSGVEATTKKILQLCTGKA